MMVTPSSLVSCSTSPRNPCSSAVGCPGSWMPPYMQRPRCSTKAPKTRRSSSSMMKSRSAITRAWCTDIPCSETLEDLVGAPLHVGQRAIHGFGAGVRCGGFLAHDEFYGRLAPDVAGQWFAQLRDAGNVPAMRQLLPCRAFDHCPVRGEMAGAGPLEVVGGEIPEEPLRGLALRGASCLVARHYPVVPIHQLHPWALEQERERTHGIAPVQRAFTVPGGRIELADHPGAIDEDASLAFEKGRHRTGVVQALRTVAALVELLHEPECAPAFRAVEVRMRGIREQLRTLLHHPGIEDTHRPGKILAGDLDEIGLAGALLELAGLGVELVGACGQDGFAIGDEARLPEQVHVQMPQRRPNIDRQAHGPVVHRDAGAGGGRELLRADP